MNLSAVGAHCKTSENVVGICNLVPCLDRQSLVNRIIVLPADKSFVSILGNYPFIFGALYPFLVFIRFIRISQSNGPARINRIEKNSFNGCFEPIVGIFRIRSTVFKTVSDVIISLWNGEIHTPHFCCDLTAAASLDSHAIHHFHIIRTVTRNQLCLVIGIFHISVGSYSRKTVTTLSFHFHNGTYFLGTILCIPFIDDILERSKIVISIITVNGIIDSNKANIVIRKKHFRIKACLQILSAETGEVFLCQVGTKKILRIYKPFIGGQPPVNGLRFLYALLPFFVRRFLYAVSNASIIGVTGSSLSGLDRYSNRMPFSRNFRSNLMKEEVSRLIREVSRARIVPMP